MVEGAQDGSPERGAKEGLCSQGRMSDTSSAKSFAKPRDEHSFVWMAKPVVWTYKPRLPLRYPAGAATCKGLSSKRSKVATQQLQT